MSYYSNYDLDIYVWNELEKKLEILIDIEKEMSIIKDFRDYYPKAQEAIGENGLNQGMFSWYSYLDNLKEFSKKYPEYIFCMEREGESSTDLETDYVKNGKSQEAYAQIVFDDFKPEIFNL